MKKPKIILKIIKEDIGYSATGKVDDILIATQGDTWQDLEYMILDVLNLSFKDKGFTFQIEEIQFKFDIASFMGYYKLFNTVELSKRVGIDEKKLVQLLRNEKKPSSNEITKLVKGIHKIAKDLSEVQMTI